MVTVCADVQKQRFFVLEKYLSRSLMTSHASFCPLAGMPRSTQMSFLVWTGPACSRNHHTQRKCVALQEELGIYINRFVRGSSIRRGEEFRILKQCPFRDSFIDLFAGHSFCTGQCCRLLMKGLGQTAEFLRQRRYVGADTEELIAHIYHLSQFVRSGRGPGKFAVFARDLGDEAGRFL